MTRVQKRNRMEESFTRLPTAREAGLLTRALSEGLIVYDTQRGQAHHLNRTAALIWRACDGGTPVAAMAARLQEELTLPADEELVGLALERLAAAHLLEDA